MSAKSTHPTIFNMCALRSSLRFFSSCLNSHLVMLLPHPRYIVLKIPLCYFYIRRGYPMPCKASVLVDLVPVLLFQLKMHPVLIYLCKPHLNISYRSMFLCYSLVLGIASRLSPHQKLAPPHNN